MNKIIITRKGYTSIRNWIYEDLSNRVFIGTYFTVYPNTSITDDKRDILKDYILHESLSKAMELGYDIIVSKEESNDIIKTVMDEVSWHNLTESKFKYEVEMEDIVEEN